MAVVAAAASRAVRTPVRTCVGCRRQAATTELLRVVAVRSASDGRETVQAVPDPRQQAPGRGAWVHPSPDCVRHAERRHAFVRALRVPGPIDAAPVAAHVAQFAAPHDSATSATPHDSATPVATHDSATPVATHDGDHDPVGTAVGERDSSDEPSMKRHQ